MYSQWYLIKEKNTGGIAVKRYFKIDRKTKWERFPKEKYKHLSLPEVEALVYRLNTAKRIEERDALERYNFDHSFVKTTILESFELMLMNSASDRNHVTTLVNYLTKYMLDFFINKKKLPHPNYWLKHEDAWGAWLLRQNLSPSTLKKIVQISNRFMKFLAKKYVGEVNSVVYEPFSRRKLQDIQARRPSLSRKKLIDDNDFEAIIKQCRDDLVPYIKLANFFGLRVAEIFGLSEDGVYKDFLSVERQVVTVEPRAVYGPLKNKQRRRVPYWFSSPKEAYELIGQLKKLHPNTVSDYFGSEMRRLKMPYEFHDLRRTFITKALRSYHWRDVQLAAGHYDIKTTMQYAQDDREMNNERWVPE